MCIFISTKMQVCDVCESVPIGGIICIVLAVESI